MLKKVNKWKIILAIFLLSILAFFTAAGGLDFTLALIGFLGFFVSLIYIVIKLFKRKFTKKYLGLPLACFIAFITGVMMTPEPTGTDPSTKSMENYTEVETEKVTEAEKILLSNFNTVDEYLAVATEGTDQGSTAMVDAISALARSDAKTASNDQLQDAITFITNSYPEYFDSYETMEKAMYFGYLLDYAYEDGDPNSELGTDTYQVIKGVYRETEKSDDQSVQENLMQITKDLAALSIVTPYQESIEAEEARQESIQASKEAAEKEQQESIQASKEAAASQKQTTEMVWISTTGSKYHKKPDCGKMNPDKAIQMSRSDAKKAGYDACKKCYK